MITRDTLKNIPVVEVKIESANDVAYFRKWNGKERSIALESMKLCREDDTAENDIEAKITVVRLSLSDANGVLLYSENDIDIEELKTIDGEILDELFVETLRANGIGDKATKDEIKNSETIQNNTSTTL